MAHPPTRTTSVQNTIDALHRGDLVGLPTETVYGLAGDATNPVAVAAVYAAKGRPAFNPLIAHVLDHNAAAIEAVLSPLAHVLIEAFWPGPLTLVAPRASSGVVCDLACAGLSTIALRAPAHPLAREVLASFKRPIAAPSANASGRVSPTDAQHLIDDALPGLNLVLDGGPCALGMESTIVALLPDEPVRVLREGAIAREEIEALIGQVGMAGAGIQAPGMLSSHYAPIGALRLNAHSPLAGEHFIGFGAICASSGPNLSVHGDLQEAASRLYALLRAADAAGALRIAVAPIPNSGLGAAINDRLQRAAAPRN